MKIKTKLYTTNLEGVKMIEHIRGMYLTKLFKLFKYDVLYKIDKDDMFVMYLVIDREHAKKHKKYYKILIDYFTFFMAGFMWGLIEAGLGDGKEREIEEWNPFPPPDKGDDSESSPDAPTPSDLMKLFKVE